MWKIIQLGTDISFIYDLAWTTFSLKYDSAWQIYQLKTWFSLAKYIKTRFSLEVESSHCGWSKKYNLAWKIIWFETISSFKYDLAWKYFSLKYDSAWQICQLKTWFSLKDKSSYCSWSKKAKVRAFDSTEIIHLLQCITVAITKLLTKTH